MPVWNALTLMRREFFAPPLTQHTSVRVIVEPNDPPQPHASASEASRLQAVVGRTWLNLVFNNYLERWQSRFEHHKHHRCHRGEQRKQAPQLPRP